ncbi:MAG: Asp-tRNA(Asn)/Glu-tRNA(Gln) amidotransferase subunit GatC [Bdellovibrionales bacterium]|nr:Asp-tRNA(Asn)/Glu-tRNA(Gln) amidotransferase subunit GatC [Bdellovibrionales bacterium]
MIDQKTIKRVASLSRIEVSNEDCERYTNELSQVLNHFDQIAQINTEGIEPLTTPVEKENLLREDVVKNEYKPEELLENAPDRMGHLFKVPPVI